MPFDGSGNYVPIAAPDFPAVAGTTIRSSQYNNQINDIAAALSDCLTRSGQSTASADQPMGGKKHLNVAAAALRTQYARAAEAQDGTLTYLTSVAGTDTITAVAPLSLAAYVAGQAFRFISAGANTGPATLNINSIGAVALTKYGTTALEAGDIPAGAAVTVVYDGVRFQLQTVALSPKQPLDATLTALAGLATGADQLPYSTGTDTFSQTPFSSFARTMLDDAAAKNLLSTIGSLGHGTKTKTAAYTVVEADRGNLIALDGTFTLSLTAAATLDTFVFVASNVGTGVITIDPDGTETIDGVATITLHPGESTAITGDASTWRTWGRVKSNGVIGYKYTETSAVATGTTLVPKDDTIPQNTEGDQYLSIDYAAKTTTNRVKVEVKLSIASNVTGYMAVSLFNGGANALATAAKYLGTANAVTDITLMYEYTPASTATLTYTVRAGLNNANTTTLNGEGGARLYGGVLLSNIAITEFKA